MQRVILAILGAQLAPAAVQARNGNVDILLEGTLDGIAAQESAIARVRRSPRGLAEVWKAREELWGEGADREVHDASLTDRSSVGVILTLCDPGDRNRLRSIQTVISTRLRAAMEQDGGSLVILGRTQARRVGIAWRRTAAHARGQGSSSIPRAR